jgi:hypothetical protein
VAKWLKGVSFISRHRDGDRPLWSEPQEPEIALLDEIKNQKKHFVK